MAKRFRVDELSGAKLRVTIACPCCGTKCALYDSHQLTNTLRHTHAQCLNPLCGWTGVAATEIIRTISPPSEVFKGDEPPILSAEEIKQRGNLVQDELV